MPAGSDRVAIGLVARLNVIAVMVVGQWTGQEADIAVQQHSQVEVPVPEHRQSLVESPHLLAGFARKNERDWRELVSHRQQRKINRFGLIAVFSPNAVPAISISSNGRTYPQMNKKKGKKNIQNGNRFLHKHANFISSCSVNGSICPRKSVNNSKKIWTIGKIFLPGRKNQFGAVLRNRPLGAIL